MARSQCTVVFVLDFVADAWIDVNAVGIGLLSVYIVLVVVEVVTSIVPHSTSRWFF